MNTPIKSLSQLIQKVSEIEVNSDSLLFFRGESKDRETALSPSIYREKYIQSEEVIYREMQRFNEHEFASDKTAFDKLNGVGIQKFNKKRVLSFYDMKSEKRNHNLKLS